MTTTIKRAMIVGGGPAGMEAALRIGQAGFKSVLIEKEAILGGTVLKLCSSFPRWEDPLELVERKIKQLNSCSCVKVMTETTVIDSKNQQNGYSILLKLKNGDTTQLDIDAVVLATGFEMMDVSVYGEYGYGIYSGVMNSLEFEAQLKAWRNDTAKTPRGVAFFECVGSRDRSKGFPYCSKICCMYTAKQAGLVTDLLPEAKAYVFYMDYRASGKGYEEFVREVIEKKHVQYIRGRPAKVIPDGGRLLVRAEDTLIGIPIEVSVDIVVLASAAVPRRETAFLAALFGAKTDEHGFLTPERFSIAKIANAVFVAGGCGFPLDIPSAQHQGAAAAAEVIGLFKEE
jgi:heterodisulfide reductase subunit A